MGGWACSLQPKIYRAGQRGGVTHGLETTDESQGWPCSDVDPCSWVAVASGGGTCRHPSSPHFSAAPPHNIRL